MDKIVKHYIDHDITKCQVFFLRIFLPAKVSYRLRGTVDNHRGFGMRNKRDFNLKKRGRIE
jgi:hypothetical protein